jgi:hypothetical protein
MRNIKELCDRLRATPWPVLAGGTGDFALYESLLAGCADRVVRGGLLDVTKVPFPDQETVTRVRVLRKNGDRSKEEVAFLEYFELLEQIRLALGGGDLECRG